MLMKFIVPQWMITSRWIGNFLTIGGYALLLHVDPVLGGCVKTIGFCMVMPFCYKTKLYDVMALASCFLVLDISNVLRIIFGH